ncbi:hypothetical protein LDENG_00237040 [Lucifuga dentata]|nr:hypothetical protein LDENG_00237040 [Lucifuga dentata]
MHFLRLLKRNCLNVQLLVTFYPLAIIKDCSHPGHHLFDLLPSGRCYRSLKSQTNRLKHSFFPTAIRSLNEFTYSG